MKNLIKLLSFIVMIPMSYAQVGTWSGTLDADGMQIPFIFHIEGSGGNYTATMDIPPQNAMDIPVQEVILVEDMLTLDLSNMGLKYQGKINGDTIEGVIFQGDEQVPLILVKGELKKPGDTSLPSSEEVFAALAAKDVGNYKYKVEDYFAEPKASLFQISPDGKYMSYFEKADDSKNHVYTKNIQTDEVKRVIEEKEELIEYYFWVNEEKLIYIMDKGGDENYHLYSVNADGSNPKDLTPFEGVKARIYATLKEDKDHIIVGLNKNNPALFEPYKLNIETGELKLLFSNEDEENPLDDFIFDKDGDLRGYSKLVDGINNQVFYTLDGGKTFNLLKELNWKSTFSIERFNYNTPDPDDAYVISNLDSDKDVIQLYDLKKNQPIKTVFEDKNYDVNDMSISRKRNYELDYFSFVGEKTVIVPQSEYFKKLHEKITKQFPNYQYIIADETDDESNYLIYVTSDKLYGKYYTYNANEDTFKLLYDLMPQLKEEDMSVMKPITFMSRDGKVIHGYITLPKAALEGKKVPVIVNVHGGPQGVRDEWGFNSEAQLFASRGYATLQVNFRISGGYGKEFLESGFGQIGRKCMDDVEDGLQYAIEQGWVDKDKVAIYGASHGGYAVLRGMTKTPDLYHCGVDYVGVSNLFTFNNSMPPYWKPYIKMIKEIWYDEEIPDQKKIMEEVSPVFHVDKIKAPLMVVQGANDPRVNIDESDQIVRSLRARGIDVPYMVKYDEGHGFSREENKLELYNAMMGFFAEHLK